jgi:hypothetical protein
MAMAGPEPAGDVMAFTVIERKLANPEMKATVLARKNTIYKPECGLTSPPQIPWAAPINDG